MFEKIVVIGVGQCALECVKYLLQHGICPELHSVGNSSSLMQRQTRELLGECSAENLFLSKEKMTENLCSQEKRTLVVSAVSNYLIPADVLKKENIVAINFHNACLPRHPGRNAEAWAIYEQDEFSGVTWHYVSEKVDAGDIIVQKKIQLNEDTTSISLLAEQNKAAILLFEEHFDEIYQETARASQQEMPSDSEYRIKMHYSWERPNEGSLDLNWKVDKISAFLRAFDYGILNIMGKPHVCYEGKEYQWKKYKIYSSNSNIKQINWTGDSLAVDGDGKRIVLYDLFEA